MRLIDADALLEQLKAYVVDCNPDHFDLNDKESFGQWMHANGINVGCVESELIVESTPTIDAEPVVRCEDCKRRGTDDCPMHIKGTPVDEEFLSKVDNDFCSYGERKGEVSE